MPTIGNNFLLHPCRMCLALHACYANAFARLKNAKNITPVVHVQAILHYTRQTQPFISLSSMFTVVAQFALRQNQALLIESLLKIIWTWFIAVFAGSHGSTFCKEAPSG